MFRLSRLYLSDTIFALCSSSGEFRRATGIAVFRISGNLSSKFLNECCNLSEKNRKRRYAHYTLIKDHQTLENIDNGLVLWFPAPASYTGENCVELHVHGSVAIVRRLNKLLNDFHPNMRIAHPGEFTKRSLINNKMDLTQVETLKKLIESESEKERKLALAAHSGGISRIIQRQIDILRKCQSKITMIIDFGEEAGLDEKSITVDVFQSINSIKKLINDWLDDNNRRQMIRNGIRLTLFGKANVGKSSLFNRICKENISIISAFAGTTRDVIERQMLLDKFKIILADTGGIIEEENLTELDELTRMKSIEQLEEKTDICLLVIDVDELINENLNFIKIIKRNVRLIMNGKETDDINEKKELKELFIIFNKSDKMKNFRHFQSFFHRLENMKNGKILWKIDGAFTLQLKMKNIFLMNTVETKEQTANHLEEERFYKSLQGIFSQHLLKDDDWNDIVSLNMNDRHEIQLRKVKNHLESIGDISDEIDYCQLSEHLRFANKELRRIIHLYDDGIEMELIFDELFKGFCIGK
ncbi:hypothetical protein SNEBB_002213 [Seison nebaliae]|nr:hypothetical protein SNEBB_002213 [Seison nebaliae]